MNMNKSLILVKFNKYILKNKLKNSNESNYKIIKQKYENLEEVEKKLNYYKKINNLNKEEIKKY